jgi:hypothetical protein
MHSIPVKAIRIAQQRLKSAGLRPGPVDGALGPKTEDALDRALESRRNELDTGQEDRILNGSRRRKVTAYIQLLARDANIEVGSVDGLWGPQTDHAFEELAHYEEHDRRAHPWRDYDGPDANPNNWPDEKPEALRAFYGEPGNVPLVRVDAPYPLRLSWDLNTKATRIACHEKVAASLERVLQGVLDHYGEERIRQLRLDRFGGCYNSRKKRGGTTWSTHAWGIALDFDPERNKLQWGRDRAAFARAEYDRWWTLWEDEGWISLGRVKNFDWMHVQATRFAH